MFRLARLILHQQRIISEYERLCEHLIVEMATRKRVPHKPFNDDLVPDAESLCSELSELLQDAEKGPGKFPTPKNNAPMS